MKVSVIIPVYQVEAYVEDCLKSVKAQTLKDLEIICIHDAGKDHSWEIVKRIAEGDERFRLLENERNLGLAATRNRGLSLAKGEYIYFLDSDDMIREDALETLYQRAIEKDLEVQVFGASFIYEEPEMKELFKSNKGYFKQKYPEVMKGRDLMIAWMEAWDWLPSQPRYFYQREFLEKHGLRFIEGMLHEDEPFSFDVLIYAERIRVTDDPFFIRRFRAASIMTGGPTIRNVEGCVKILAHIAALQGIYGEDPAWNQAVKFYHYKIFCDVCRKYKRAMAGTEKPLYSLLSGEMKENPEEMAIYHLIEAYSLWGEVK